MQQVMDALRKTTDSKSLGITRIFMGMMILLPGLMKLFVPSLREAFLQQLMLSGLPFPVVSFWVVPFVEVVAGAMLLVGLWSRLASIAVMGMMVVATYVHLVVKDPTVFPLQPTEPIIPVFLIVIGVFVFIRGGGAWSWDLKASRREVTGTDTEHSA